MWSLSFRVLSFDITCLVFVSSVHLTCFPVRYQSEDLTDQRRSYKCFPLLNEQAEVPSNSSSIISWNEFITLSSAIVVLAAVVVAFATYYLKSNERIYSLMTIMFLNVNNYL
jgi:hypothetical protein